MNKKTKKSIFLSRIVIASIFICTLSIGSSVAQSFPGSSLILKLIGFKNNKGKVYAALYQSRHSRFSDTEVTYKVVSSKIDNKNIELTFTDLPAGKYAIVVFHDENNNQIMDRTFIGIPKEGFGFSRNIKPKTQSPFMDECSIEIKPQIKHETSINICYW